MMPKIYYSVEDGQEIMLEKFYDFQRQSDARSRQKKQKKYLPLKKMGMTMS